MPSVATGSTWSPSTTTSPSATREWMGRIHRFLGLEVGLIQSRDDAGGAPPGLRPPTSPTAPTTSSASTTSATTCRCAPICGSSAATPYAIVDEVDSILVDEARTPLIISGSVGDTGKYYLDFARSRDSFDPRRPLRGGREEAPGHHHRGRGLPGGAGPRGREHVRLRQRRLHPPPRHRPQGQGAVPTAMSTTSSRTVR